MSSLFEQLAQSPKAELEALLGQGQPPDPDALVGHEFRGFNVGRGAALLGVQKFIKGFFRGLPSVEGYNIRVRQNGLAAPWLPKPTVEAPVRFGFFLVTPVGPDVSTSDCRHPGSALLDYGSSLRNPRWRPERVLRDYLAVPDPAQPNVLLGKAYATLGRARLPVGFFIIERMRPTAWQP